MLGWGDSEDFDEGKLMRLLQISAKRWGIVVFGGLALALLSSSAASAPAPARPGSAKLTFRLAALASSDLRSAPRAEQAAALSLPARGPGSLLRVNGNPLVQIRTDGTSAATRKALEAAGARIVNVSAKYRTFTAAVPAANLQRISAVGGVQAVTDILTPMTSSWGGGGISALRSTCPQGVKVSEGDVQLRANLARSAYGVNGAGVKVGILSDSFDTSTATIHAANDVASGDLPGSGNTCGFTTPVQVLSDLAPGSGQEDEGRAMAQIVHDLAPGASLAFATAFAGESAFADNIVALKAAGAKVIVDDVSYFDEPFFQDGLVTAGVNTATATGATYFSSAANNNILDGSGNAISSFEAPAFRDSASCPLGSPSYAIHCMDFNPGAATDNTYGISVPNNRTVRIDLQWAEPWYGVATDLDAYLIDSANVLRAKSEYFNVTITQTPFEFLAWSNTTGVTQNVNLAINRYSGFNGGGTATPRIKFAFFENGGQTVVPTEYTTSSGGDIVGPTIYGHNGAGNTMSTAAVPYNNSAAPEVYSSRGPLTLYFGPVNGTTPAPAISPTTLNKPDIAATDGGSNTFFPPPCSPCRFYGTSAAAPHAAAVAALELQAKPTASVTQVKNAQISTASAVGAFTHPAVGAGLINAKAAVGSLVKCKVPKVTGKKLAAAKTAIKKAKCAVGRISKAFSRRVKKGRVISQKPAAGKTVAFGTKVNLVVSKGKRR